MRQSWRLTGKLPPEFAAPVIDRRRTIEFRFNGRRYLGFEGDTVLSALLANGVVCAGEAGGSPLALDAVSAPAICVAGNESRTDLFMPMALCPIMAGISYVTAGPRPAPGRGIVSRLLRGGRTSLGLAYGEADPEPGGWIDSRPDRTISTDTVIIGGGVAGLSAAIAAAERGLRVVVVDQEPVLGGMSVFFGKADGDPAPEEMIGALADRIGQLGLVTLMPGTLAYGLEGTSIRAVRIDRSTETPKPEHLIITGRTVVLATGMTGRLPVFAGNRLPGVRDAAAAWRLAARYNVWPGRTAHIHTATNVGYRMALLGAAAGKTIIRTSDPRNAPQTRFIEFCKAYGHRLGWGTTVAAVKGSHGMGLATDLVNSDTGVARHEDIASDTLIVSGGWQPEIDLWLTGGGAVAWDAQAGQLVPTGAMDGVELAGSAAGYLGLIGCRDHGRTAMLDVLDGTTTQVADPQIDPIFEAPDGPQTIHAPGQRGLPPAWLSPGRAGQLPPPRNSGPLGWFGRASRDNAEPPSAGTALDIAGAVIGDLLPPHLIARYCAHHCTLPVRLQPAPLDMPRRQSGGLPLFLRYRFGDSERLQALALTTSRTLEPGCLIFVNTDARSPLAAIGVVISGEAGAVEALMAADGPKPGETVYIRDGLAVIPATLKRAS